MNPQTYVGEPDYGPGMTSGPLLLLVVFGYVAIGWLLFRGPAQHWADKNKGLAWVILALWPLPLLFIVR